MSCRSPTSPTRDSSPTTRRTPTRRSRRSSRCAHRGRAERAGRPAGRRRLRRVERVRRTVRDADRRAARRERAQVQPLPHDGAVLAHPPGAADRAQPPLGGDGWHHRDRHLGAWLQLDPAEHRRAAGGDAEAERLLDGAVRQVPRGAGLGDEPDGAVRRLAERGGGFEHFYGFIGGETNQYAPAIYDGTVPVEPDRSPEEGYHFTEDMTDRAIAWIRQQKALMPDKPFFAYFAPGATHAPHHVPTNGRTGTRASSTRAGTRCARRRSRARRSWA